MKLLNISSALLLIAVGGVPAMGKESLEPTVAGCWALDTSKLPMPPMQRPKSVTICFKDVAANKISMSVGIVAPDDAKVRSEGSYLTDGTPGKPDMGTEEADMAVARRPAPNVLVMALSKDNHMASTRVYVAQADGKALTETVVYYPEGGASNTRVNEFTRVAD